MYFEGLNVFLKGHVVHGRYADNVLQTANFKKLA